MLDLIGRSRTVRVQMLAHRFIIDVSVLQERICVTAYLLNLYRRLDFGDILLDVLFQFVQRDLLPYLARHRNGIHRLTACVVGLLQ